MYATQNPVGDRGATGRRARGTDAVVATYRTTPRGGEVNDNELVSSICEGLVKRSLVREHLHTATEAQHQVEGRLLLDVVVRQRAPVFELLASKDQPLLVWWDALLVLDLCLDVVDRV